MTQTDWSEVQAALEEVMRQSGGGEIDITDYESGFIRGVATIVDLLRHESSCTGYKKD